MSIQANDGHEQFIGPDVAAVSVRQRYFDTEERPMGEGTPLYVMSKEQTSECRIRTRRWQFLRRGRGMKVLVNSLVRDAPSSRRRPGAHAVLALLVLVAVLVLAYVRVGWWRMGATCSSDVPGAARTAATSVELGWSWSPPGFTCTFSDGRTRTSLWF